MCDSYEIEMDFGDKVCKSCLTNTDDMKSLSDPYSTEMCVADVFTFVTSLKCSGDNDDLSTQICHECFGALHSSYQFVLKSRESDKKLQTYLNKIHITKGKIVADNTRNISNITINDCTRSVKSENATHLRGTTLLKTGHNMNTLIEEIHLGIKTELNTLSNDLRSSSSRELSTENEIKLERYKSNDNIHRVQPTITPLLIAEMQKELDQDLDLIKHKIDIKTEITNDVYDENSIAVNNEPANEQHIAISSEIHLQSNQTANIITSEVSKQMENELNDSLITHNQYTQTNTVTPIEINKTSTASIEMTANDHEHVQVLPKIRRHLENRDETKNFNDKVNQTRMHIRDYTCAVCNKSFNFKRNLLQHMGTHTGEKPYSCTLCNKSYRQKHDLVRHTRTHTGERPYTCTVCNHSFSRKESLVRHTRTHTEEKPYSCIFCNKSYSQKQDLVRHMRTHTGEKPFACPICNKSFSQKQFLGQHARTHTGEKPYTCTACSKSFSQKSNLIVHMRTHTGENPYYSL